MSGIGAFIEAKADNFLPALRLAIEILKEPAFPESDFEQIRRQRLAAIDASRTDPASQGSLLLARRVSVYPKGHPLYVGTLDEQVEELQKLTLEGWIEPLACPDTRFCDATDTILRQSDRLKNTICL